jgi:hypothetical protein
LRHATDFYENLFEHAEDAGVRLNGDIWDNGEKLNDSDRERMNRRFIEEEVKEVIDQREKIKLQVLMEFLLNSIRNAGI